MPRKSSWIERIPLILQHLETDAQAVYTRPEVQALFIIGRSQATDLMRIAGAEVRNGTEATASRDNLRYYVERCPAAKAYLAEEERKKQLARKMRVAAEEVRLRSVSIPYVRKRDEWTRWGDMPNVALQPGILQVTFSDHRELLHALVLISKAIANETDEFLRMCDGAPARSSI